MKLKTNVVLLKETLRDMIHLKISSMDLVDWMNPCKSLLNSLCI